MVFPAAWAQEPGRRGFKEFSPNAQIRDAVISADGDVAYLAAFDRNEVWQASIPSGEVRASAAVGRGPTALALSTDDVTLACVNRLSNSISLINTADMSLITTVDCNEGPGAVTALPGGGFAVTNSFADTVTLIDPKRPDAARVLEGVSGVPNGVAASESMLAVTVRVPPSVLLFSGGGETPTATVALPDSPGAVVALPADRFAVATKSAVLLIDGAGAEVAGKLDLAAYDLAVWGDRLLALTDNSVEVLDGQLAQTDRFDLKAPGRALAVADDLVAVLSPTTKTWRIHGVFAESPVVVARVEPGDATAPPPASSEAVAEREAARQEYRQTAKAQRTTGPVPAGAPRTSFGGDEPSTSTFRQTPQGKTIAESVGDSLTVGPTEGGFVLPDWTKPLRDLEWDGEFEKEGNRITATDNVRLTLDTIKFRADYLFYDKDLGELHVRGNVKMTQGESKAFADEVKYVLSEEKREDTPPPLTTADTDADQELARKMLTLGSLDAINIEIFEPARRLKADRMIYDFTGQVGQAYGVEGEAGTFFFGCDQLDLLGPDQAEGDNIWLTTCEPDHEYYKIRLKHGSIRGEGAVLGTGARLELGNTKTPIRWPRWSVKGGDAPTVDVDIDAGRRAELGYYLSLGQQFSITPNVQVGYRFWPTEKEGVGFGIEGGYNFMDTPASPMFLSAGSFRSLYTTNDRGYIEWYHRHDIYEDTVMLAQVEQWFDADFYKDFWYDEYRNRTDPRTFVNVTHTKPTYLATATIRKRTNGFTAETERLPEATFHLLERRLAKRLYVTFDTVNGYNVRRPSETDSIRSANVARLTYDVELGQSLNVTPFLEVDGAWYSENNEGDSDFRFSNTVGTTFQSRFHKAYPGRFGFSGFKHLVVPSITYSYRPNPSMEVEETPRFDAYDNVYGRSRIESKLDNIVYGRDAESGLAWQVVRLSLYQGTDLWNDVRKSDDYEIEMNLRPRPWWGFHMVGEHHTIEDDTGFDSPYYLEGRLLRAYERFAKQPYDTELTYLYNAAYGDYDRLLAYLLYERGPLNERLDGRIGYAYTATQDRVFNRELIYGLGYKLGEKWSMAFEHRYDLEGSGFHRQKYEVRRVFQCLEGAVMLSERSSGWDIRLELGVSALPGAKLKF